MSSVAALVVTNRPAFVPWWTHQIRKQTRRPDQVVVVTNAASPEALLDGHLAGRCGVDDVVVYWQPPEPWVSLGWMRQRAVDLCSADIFLWMDDDDWYHPRRVEMSCTPIESERYDAAVFPLTHWYYLSDRCLRHMHNDIRMHLPAVAWRREVVARAKFFHVAAAEDCHWIHRIVHCKWAPPLVQGSRVRWIGDYAYPHVGAIVVVHGGNTWQDIDGRASVNAEKVPPFAYPPKDVSKEEWHHTVETLTNMVPTPQSPRRKYKPSSRDEWDVAHRSGLTD